MPRIYLPYPPTARPGDWASNRNRGCAQPGVNPDWFFPNKGGNHQLDVGLAVDTCRRCPFIRECREYALDQPGLHGIWGGTTVRQRRNLRRARKAAA
jgi:WhiB family redox-sensing transcriptional regulator